MRTHRKAVQDRFVDAVRAGDKVTTIRPRGLRTIIPEAGDEILFFRWTGRPYRSKQAIVGRFRITRCREVRVNCVCVTSSVQRPGWPWPVDLDIGRTDVVARREGFSAWRDMVDWFRHQHGLPFYGIMIEWDPARLDDPDPFPIP